jgi:hypothetical protein
MRRGGMRVMFQRDRTGAGNRAASPLVFRPRTAFRNVLLCSTVARQNNDCLGSAWLPLLADRIGGNGWTYATRLGAESRDKTSSLMPRRLRTPNLTADSRAVAHLAADLVMVAVTTAQPAMPDPRELYEVIHLGGQEAAIVPLADLRRLEAVERLAPTEVIDSAEIETTLAAHRQWAAAGRPGAVSREQAMAELLAGS